MLCIRLNAANICTNYRNGLSQAHADQSKYFQSVRLIPCHWPNVRIRNLGKIDNCLARANSEAFYLKVSDSGQGIA